MLYHITHRTTYEYSEVVPECFNIVRLYPRRIFDQVCIEHRLQVNPQPVDFVRREDYFGNTIEQFSIHVPHQSLQVTAINRIEVTPRNYPQLNSTPTVESIASLEPHDNLEAYQYCQPSPFIRWNDDIADYAQQSLRPDRPIAEAAMELTTRINQDFKFDAQATTLSTPVEEVFQNRAGVCQDFAHFQLACFRSLNLPARYVSGYLRTSPPPGKPRLVGADASHAWASLYCGAAGWFDFDPTNNVIPATDHITIAWGRDYSDVCPVQGVFTGGGATTMNVAVDVVPDGELEPYRI